MPTMVGCDYEMDIRRHVSKNCNIFNDHLPDVLHT